MALTPNQINQGKRIALHLVIVAAAAVCSELLKLLPTFNFGDQQIFIVPIISGAIKAVLTILKV